MKLLLYILVLSTTNVFGAEKLIEVNTKAQLTKYVSKRIMLEGIYHDPGKGSRHIKCSFGILRIQDYSFYKQSKDGFLTTDIKNGDLVKFTAKLNYFKGSKVLVKKQRVVQQVTPPIQIIGGKEYYVRPPSYSISEAKLIEVTKQKAKSQQPNETKMQNKMLR